jgi:hypothetical protein
MTARFCHIKGTRLEIGIELGPTSASNLGPPRVQKYTKGTLRRGAATLSRWGLAERNEFVASATDEWSAARPQRLPHLILPIPPPLA